MWRRAIFEAFTGGSEIERTKYEKDRINRTARRVGEMSYKDKTFCPKADKNNPKCIQCDRFFDSNEYNIACEKAGFEIPVAWFLEPPCEAENKKRKKDKDER